MNKSLNSKICCLYPLDITDKYDFKLMCLKFAMFTFNIDGKDVPLCKYHFNLISNDPDARTKLRNYIEYQYSC